MRTRSRSVALIVWGLALMLSGCGGTSQQLGMRGAGLSESGSSDTCTWTFDREPDGKVVAKSVVVKERPGVPAGSCKVHVVKSLSITDKDTGPASTLTSVGPQGFISKDVQAGTCCWWVWTGGGWLCIQYPC